MSPRARLLLSVALALPFGAHAGDLTLDDAARRAVAADPRLAAELAALAAAEAQASLDALPPPTTLGGELENVAGTGELSGTGSAEATFRVARILERGGKQAARRRVGDAAIARQAFRLEARRLELMAEVAARFIAVLGAEAELQLAQRQVDAAVRVNEAVAYRVSRGVAAASDQKLSAIAVTRAELAREHAEHELAAANTELSILFGLESPDFDGVAGALTPLPAMPELAQLAARLPRTATQRAFALEGAEIDARAALARSGRSPDVTLSLGVRRVEALDDQGLVASVSVPLGTRERAAYAAARANAERDALEARIEAARRDDYRSLFQQYQELRHARTEFDAIDTAMIPAATEALALTQDGFDAARYSYLQLAQAHAALVELERQRTDAAIRYHRQLVAIERATAVPEGTPP